MQTAAAGIAVWAALLGRGTDSQTPPGRREPMPTTSSKVIFLRTRQTRHAVDDDKAV